MICEDGKFQCIYGRNAIAHGCNSPEIIVHVPIPSLGMMVLRRGRLDSGFSRHPQIGERSFEGRRDFDYSGNVITRSLTPLEIVAAIICVTNWTFLFRSL